MKDIAKSLNLAITIISCILFGLVIGYVADSLAKTSPTFMIVGIIAGTLFAFMVLYKMARNK